MTSKNKIMLEGPIYEWDVHGLIQAYEGSEYFYPTKDFDYEYWVGLTKEIHTDNNTNFDISDTPVEDFMISTRYCAYVWKLLSLVYDKIYQGTPKTIIYDYDSDNTLRAVTEIPSLNTGDSATECWYTSWLRIYTDDMFRTLNLKYKSSPAKLGACFILQCIFENYNKSMHRINGYAAIDIVISYEDMYEAAVKNKQLDAVPITDYVVKFINHNANNPTWSPVMNSYISRSCTLSNFNIFKALKG